MRILRRLVLTGILAIALALVLHMVTAQEGGQDVKELYEGKVDAPEFPEGLEWINVDAPLTISGQVSRHQTQPDATLGICCDSARRRHRGRRE